MIEIIKQRFKTIVEETFVGKPDVIKYLLNHERKDLFLYNMCKHLAPVDAGLTRVTLTRSKIDEIVKDMTLFFCKIAIDQVEKTLIERIKKEAEHAKEMEEFKTELDERAEFTKKVF